MRILPIALAILIAGNSAAQKVGVVLSGGGATAIAHVGFLRALEENHVPIDYIGGTSMGAVIGAMYASGFSVDEIDSITASPEFLQMATGEIDDHLRFYFKTPPADASMATIKYSEGEFISNALPASLINPVLLDWNFMAAFSQADAAAGYDFDSLFIPFRCIAADIYHKEQVIFRSGHLNVAARASSTFPFYLPSRRVDGNLLFDGGIYNNFPADIIYHEFLPDVILGCNVSENSAPPTENDLFSQLENMIQYSTNFDPICEQMIIVEPELEEVGTFDFEKITYARQVGYTSTLARMNDILNMIGRREEPGALSARRQAFRGKFKPLLVDEIEVSGLENAQKNYVRQIMGRKQEVIRLDDLKVPYFRVFGDDKIRSIFPQTELKPETGRYRLKLEVEKEKDLFMSFGGNFASRSINAGFIGLRYNIFGRTSATLSANSYFGRFYGSVHSNIRWDIGRRVPFSLQGEFTFNRWDFYKSLTTFFEDVKPSFIVQNERTAGISANLAAGNKGLLRFEGMYSFWFDEYYQTQEFLSTDTADHTEFRSVILRSTWERNTLNRKQYPSKGTYLSISVKYVNGEEWTIPGSTSLIRDTTKAYHNWAGIRLKYINYFSHWKKFSAGMHLEAVAFDQSVFSNYISSVIAAPAFRPIPESFTYFMPRFRAHSYVACGLIGNLSLAKNLDLRAEGYAFNAFGRINPNSFTQAELNYTIVPAYIASTSLVYHSPLGPVSLSANYYEYQTEPWSFLFNFGYILFNPSSRD